MAFQYSFPLAGSSNPDPQHTAMASSLPDMSPWTQLPPSVMPWTMENRPHLVRFGESSGDTQSWGIPRPKYKFYKRKSDLDYNVKPAKIHITEEKMAAQLKNMHISNNYTVDQGFGEALEKSDCTLPILTLSKEVQNLPCFQEPLLPQSILSKMEKSTRALVLWKPPAGSLSSQLISSLSESEEETDNVNNNTAALNLNAHSPVSQTPPEFMNSGIEMEM